MKKTIVCNSDFACDWCGKVYMNRSGLWKHQLRCEHIPEDDKPKRSDSQGKEKGKDKVVIGELVPQTDHQFLGDASASNAGQVQNQTPNQSQSQVTESMVVQMLKYFQETERKREEQQQLMERQLEAEREQCKKLMNTVQDMIPKLGSYNNNNININVFLQEHCKDALNLQDFVASLQIELTDISKCHERSMIDTVGNVFVNGLRQLDLYKRPIHCTDLTQETLFIKENDVWGNEMANKAKLRGALSAVAATQSKAIQEWESSHPNWSDSDTLTAEYLRLVKATTCPIEQGSMDESKIITNIAREVVVDLDNSGESSS